MPSPGAATLALVMALAPAPASAGEPTITVSPPKLAPGEPFRITVNASAPMTRVGGSFGGAEIPFLPESGGNGARWIGFAAVDLDAKPGRLALRIRTAAGDGRWRTQLRRLEVARREFPTESLTVEEKYVEPPPEVRERIAREAALLEGIWKRLTAELLWTGIATAPIPGIEGRNFGRRRIFNGKPRSPHSGSDLSAPEGTPVRAAAGGRVVLAQEMYFPGNLVVLDHGAGVYTLYAHLASFDVREGDRVEAGQILGRVGATGRATGPHLHWAARIGQARVDPFSLLRLLSAPAPSVR